MMNASFKGHVGEDNRGHEEVKDSFGVQDRNAEGRMVDGNDCSEEQEHLVEVGDQRWTTSDSYIRFQK